MDKFPVVALVVIAVLLVPISVYSAIQIYSHYRLAEEIRNAQIAGTAEQNQREAVQLTAAEAAAENERQYREAVKQCPGTEQEAGYQTCVENLQRQYGISD